MFFRKLYLYGNLICILTTSFYILRLRLFYIVFIQLKSVSSEVLFRSIVPISVSNVFLSFQFRGSSVLLEFLCT